MKKLLCVIGILVLFSCAKNDDTTNLNLDLNLEIKIERVTLRSANISWTVNGERKPPEGVLFRIELNGTPVKIGHSVSNYDFNFLEENTVYNVVVYATVQNEKRASAEISFTTLLNTVYVGDYRLHTQEQADDFYYTEVTGRLTIQGEDVTDISNLSSLERVGDLTIINTNFSSLEALQGLNGFRLSSGSITLFLNDFLVDVSALSNLANSTSELRILHNPKLQNLEGLGLAESADNLEINFTPINNLSTFSNVLELEKLSLDNLDQLENLEGFNNLESVRVLELGDGLRITNFEGLNNLKTIGRFVDLHNLDSLESFQGLESLETILGRLTVVGCDNLSSFDGLSNLRSLSGYLQVRDCDMLVEFGTFPSLASIGGPLLIEYLPSLNSIDGFNNLHTIEGEVVIIQNEQLQSINGFSGLRNTSGLNLLSLDNLTTVEAFGSIAAIDNINLTELPNLNNISWLNGLQRVDNELQIFESGLSSLDGLNNLTRVNKLELHYLEISNLDGLEGLTAIENLEISFCDSLLDLNGTSLSIDINPNDVGTFTFQNNSQLTNYCGFTNYVNNVPCFWFTSGNAYNPTKTQVESNVDCSL